MCGQYLYKELEKSYSTILLQIKNHLLKIRKWLIFFVDRRFEISNLDLIRDMGKILKLGEVILIASNMA